MYVQVLITSNYVEDGEVVRWIESKHFDSETSRMQDAGNGLYVDCDGEVTWYVQVIGQRR